MILSASSMLVEEKVLIFREDLRARHDQTLETHREIRKSSIFFFQVKGIWRQLIDAAGVLKSDWYESQIEY
jgi:hypothetical protein